MEALDSKTVNADNNMVNNENSIAADIIETALNGLNISSDELDTTHANHISINEAIATPVNGERMDRISHRESDSRDLSVKVSTELSSQRSLHSVSGDDGQQQMVANGGNCCQCVEYGECAHHSDKAVKHLKPSDCEPNSVNVVLSDSKRVASNDVVSDGDNDSYPLRYCWQLWFWRADQGVKVVWIDALQKVCAFNTIDDFWRLYYHIKSLKHLRPPSDYCVFKDGIKPMWEDEANINGGRWILEFAKGPNRESNPHLDQIWLEVLLCLIGEGFADFGDQICGAVVNIRSKEDRISVWTANADKSVANLRIGEILKMRTGYRGVIKYEAHTTAQKLALLKEREVPNKVATNASHAKTARRSCIF